MRVARLAGRAPTASITFDRAGTVVALNAAAERLLGRTSAELAGLPVASVLPRLADPSHGSAGDAGSGAVGEAHAPLRLLARTRSGEERVVSVSVAELPGEDDRLVAVLHETAGAGARPATSDHAGGDGTDPLTAPAERDLRRRLVREAERSRESAARLQALTAALAATYTPEEVAEVVVAQGMAATGASTGMLALRDAAVPDEAVVVRQDGIPPALGAHFHRLRLDDPRPAARCLRTGEPIFIGSPEELAARFPEMRLVWEGLRTRALATVPLVVAGETVGAMSFTFSDPFPLPTEDREFYLALGRQAAQALERARLFEAERAARAEVEQLNAELRETLADLQAVLTVVPIGIGIARDPECRDIRVNPAFAGQLGIAPDVNASKSGNASLAFRVLRDGEEIPPDELPMQRAAREGVTVAEVEVDIVHDDGRVVRLLEYAAPLFDAEGKVRGAVGAFIDITERARLVEAERAALAQAEQANRAKAEFLAVMSHELRTPLNAIGGYAELLAAGVRGPVTPQQVEDLERVKRNQRHLLGLINEVLNYARLETGRVSFDLRAVHVAVELADLESLILPQVQAKELTLETLPCDPAVTVRADAEKLRQVLLNLLSNAVKFTGRGGRITLACRTREDGPSPGAGRPRAGVPDDGTPGVEPAGGIVEISVRDTGTGISAEHLERIFEPFVQVGRALNSPVEGAGLGLAISRDLARGMGGDLVARSAPGEGSEFVLTLPRA